MTAACSLPRSSFPSGTGQLRSAPAPRPQAPPPPPTCALPATLHCRPASTGSLGPSEEPLPLISGPSDPFTQPPSPTKLTSTYSCAAASLLPAWWGPCWLGLGLGIPSASPLWLPIRGLGGLPWLKRRKPHLILIWTHPTSLY